MALADLLSQLRSVVREFFLTTSTMSLILGFLALLLFWSAIQTFMAWYRLRHFPGPLQAKLSKWWLIKHTNGGRMHMDFAEVNWKYGMCFFPSNMMEPILRTLRLVSLLKPNADLSPAEFSSRCYRNLSLTSKDCAQSKA
jgi:hypothetical protein